MLHLAFLLQCSCQTVFPTVSFFSLLSPCPEKAHACRHAVLGACCRCNHPYRLHSYRELGEIRQLKMLPVASTVRGKSHINIIFSLVGGENPRGTDQETVVSGTHFSSVTESNCALLVSPKNQHDRFRLCDYSLMSILKTSYLLRSTSMFRTPPGHRRMPSGRCPAPQSAT